MTDPQLHIPILVEPILEYLQVAITAQGHYVDGTLGAGGHTVAILTHNPNARVLGFDRDPNALQIARERLANYLDRVTLIHDTYETMTAHVHAWLLGNTPQVDGILLDLGLSSMQVDQAERGFSFRHEGALDMRFDPTADSPTAAELVNHLDEADLANLIYRYGEESQSRRIARQIVQSRPIHTTTQLANIIAALFPRHRDRIHPATLTFQALRIAVNDELKAVETVLPNAIDLLKSGGRLAVITFHSLEDRIVKQTFKTAATDCICPPEQPICTCDHHATIRLITRKPHIPNTEEIQTNPRARSAKLRVIEKM